MKEMFKRVHIDCGDVLALDLDENSNTAMALLFFDKDKTGLPEGSYALIKPPESIKYTQMIDILEQQKEKLDALIDEYKEANDAK